MLATKIGDPRLQELFGTNGQVTEGVRPVVRLPRKWLPPALLVVGALCFAAALFSALNRQRIRHAEPAIHATTSDVAANSWQAPPPLFIPLSEPAKSPPPLQPTRIPLLAVVSAPAAPPRNVRLESRIALAPPTSQPPAFAPPQARFPLVQPRGGAPLLIDDGSAAPPAFLRGRQASSELPSDERVRASVLAKPSQTVPQGSLIPAVLETGFDSMKPGFARAVVSRDVRSFDGENVLIPRGSRLIGESSASVADGQQRATITWSRLIRPDGATIQLDSPGTDPVGRNGVPASVNTHFLARVGDVISTTVGSLGQILAARASPFIILSGNAASVVPKVSHPKRAPSLKVAPGTSIGVFVAHDLEFSTPGDRP